MERPIVKASRIGASVGFLMAVLVIGYGYLEPHIHGPAVNDWLIFAACPSSIALMAADAGNWYDFVFADLIVVAANAAWYGVLFVVIAIIFRRSRNADVSARQT